VITPGVARFSPYASLSATETKTGALVTSSEPATSMLSVAVAPAAEPRTNDFAAEYVSAAQAATTVIAYV